MNRFNLSQWALKHPALIVFAMLVSLALGVMAYFQLGRAEDPDFTIKVMTIDVAWPGARTRNLEQQVVGRIERALQEVPHFDHVSSYTRPGRSTLFLTLNDWTPKDQVAESWYQARKRVDDIRHTLPADIQGPFFNDNFGDTFGSIYAFHSDGFDDGEMKQVLLATRERILRIPDVSKVELLGVQEERIHIEFSHARLAQLGIAPQDLFASLQRQNAVEPAGVIETPSARIFARVDGAVTSTQSIESVAVEAGGRVFRLGDVATVSRGFIDPPVVSMRRNGERLTGLAVSMVLGGDILRLGQALDREIAEIQRELPAGIGIEKISDQPTIVDHSVDEFVQHFLLALAIVLGVSFVALGWRTGVVVALSVPLVLAITFLIMWMLGINLQRIALGALIIALGLLVDDAIIAVEMIQVKLEEGWDRFRAASHAWTSTAFPMLTGTVITAAGFVPVGFAKSSTSEFTNSIFWVVAISLMVSWLVAVVFTPFLGAKLLPAAQPGHGTHRDGRFHRWLAGGIEWCVAHRKLVIAATAASFVLALGAFSLVPQQFFPASSREEILIDVQLEEGASYAATLREVERVERILEQDSRVVNFTSYVGSGAPRFFLALDPELPKINYAQVIVYPRDLDVAPAIADDLRQRLDTELSHIRTRVSRLENGPPVGYPVQFRVSGPDPDTVRDIAAQVRDRMRENPHVHDVHLQWNERTKAVRLVIDQDRARALGLNTQDVARTLQSLLSGYTVTQLREGTELIDVVARATEAERGNAANLGDLTIRTRTGTVVPLSQVAVIEPGLEEGGIWRRNREPTLSVRADVLGNAQPPDVSNQIEPTLEDIRAALPVGYRIEVGGTIEESAKATAAIEAVMPVMLLLWITFLMLQLQSFSRVFMVILTAPLGMIGVTLALLVTQAPFGFVAQLGVIALAGMIMRNSVILVDQIDRDIAAGEARWTAIVGATVRRTRPVVLTALAAILAMIPLTFSLFWGPMAIAIMGGLAVATVLTLFFVPALYAAWFRVRRNEPTKLAEQDTRKLDVAA